MGSRLALTLLALTLLVPAQASTQTRPTMRIVRSAPLTVRGAWFKPRESVRLRVVTGERALSRQLRAGALGGFTVRFIGVRLNYCVVPLVVTARGAASGLVRLNLPPVDCAMP
jgi:hypothetical protein